MYIRNMSKYGLMYREIVEDLVFVTLHLILAKKIIIYIDNNINMI